MEQFCEQCWPKRQSKVHSDDNYSNNNAFSLIISLVMSSSPPLIPPQLTEPLEACRNQHHVTKAQPCFASRA